MNDDNKEYDATDLMFASVGRAITQWSFVELTLCNLFTICVTPCPTRPAKDDEDQGYVSMIDSAVPTATFYSIESFRGKLGLVDAALRARIPENKSWAIEAREKWAKLYDKTRRLSLKRNRLAHWTVIPAFDDGEVFHDARLMPPYGSPGWWKETGSNPPGDILKTSQVQHLCVAFNLIDEKLRAFYKDLAQNAELHDKYDKLTVRLIQSHDRLNPNRAELIRRDLASRG